MARTKGLVTEDKIKKAWETYARFGNVDLSTLPPCDLASLVKINYSNIRGISFEYVPEKQLFRIAERLRDESIEIVSEHEFPYADILNNIRQMRYASGEERELLEERVCIQLEGNNIPDNHYLSRMYKEAKYPQRRVCAA